MTTFYALKKYCRYLLKAKKGKSAHSPFLHNLSMKIFDKKCNVPQINYNLCSNKKYNILIYNIAAYFNIKQIIIVDASCSTLNQIDATPYSIVQYADLTLFLNTTFLPAANLIVIKKKYLPDQILEHFDELMKYTNNNSVLIYEGLYSTQEKEKVWKQIKSHKKTTVTLDLFKLGVVFFRKESSKENFIVKY